MAESQDGFVAVAVAGTRVHIGVRAQLNGAERKGRAGIGIPGQIRSVEHVHIIRRLPAAGGQQQNGETATDKRFHGLFVIEHGGREVVHRDTGSFQADGHLIAAVILEILDLQAVIACLQFEEDILA